MYKHAVALEALNPKNQKDLKHEDIIFTNLIGVELEMI
jgi:hypothetical protein